MNGNSNTNGNTNNSMNGNGSPMPQSWNDLVVMQPMDIRSIVSLASFEDNAAAMHTATFERSLSWLGPGPWSVPPLSVSVGNGPTTPSITVPNAYDYASQQIANVWNASHQMTPIIPTALPLAVQQTAFLHAGAAFVNNLFFDWKVGVTSSSIQLSLRDNSTTSGMFQNGSVGTVPVFLFPGSAIYGGLGRNLQVTLLRTGRFNVAFVIVDSTGATSMFEMDWIVL